MDREILFKVRIELSKINLTFWHLAFTLMFN